MFDCWPVTAFCGPRQGPGVHAGTSAAPTSALPPGLEIQVALDDVVVEVFAYEGGHDGCWKAAEYAAEDCGSEFQKEALAPTGCHRCCTGNVKVLALTAALFSVITVGQVIAALAANSLAMLQDSVSMGVDALTYLGNIVVETQRGKRTEVLLELGFGVVSISVLVCFTLLFMQDAWTRLSEMAADQGEEETNPYIVLAFAIWGLVFDAAAMCAFVWNHRKSSAGAQLNMCTAFLHVGADFLRSSTTFVASILMLCFDYHTGATDAWASLIVGTSILAVGGAGFLALLRKARQALRSGTLSLGCLPGFGEREAPSAPLSAPKVPMP